VILWHLESSGCDRAYSFSLVAECSMWVSTSAVTSSADPERKEWFQVGVEGFPAALLCRSWDLMLKWLDLGVTEREMLV